MPFEGALRGLLLGLQLVAVAAVLAGTAATLAQLCRRAPVNRARLAMARTALNGLSLLTVAAIVNTLMLRDWQSVGLAFTLLGLRVGLGGVFRRERRHLEGHEKGAPGPGAPG